jgi:hypothetical protein
MTRTVFRLFPLRCFPYVFSPRRFPYVFAYGSAVCVGSTRTTQSPVFMSGT